MKEPNKVADCLKAMSQGVAIPCHIKCRIGVDDEDSYDFVKNFVQIVSSKGGCNHFIIHSRKCILKGLNPHENRTIPPLNYDVVKQLKKDFPKVHFSINGGIKTYEQIDEFLKEEHGILGVMVGRMAYENPWVLSDIDRRVYKLANPGLSRKEILKVWGKYCDKEIEKNVKMSWPTLTKPIINLFHNEPNSSVFRRILSDREIYKKCKSFSEMI